MTGTMFSKGVGFGVSSAELRDTENVEEKLRVDY